MRSLAVVVVVFVLGFAGLAAWLAVSHPSPDPADATRTRGPAAVVALPATPKTADPAPPGKKPGKAPAARADHAALVEESQWGPLPRVAPDGRSPTQVYARPFSNPDQRPRVAILVTGLGLASELTEAAVKGLPGPVTLAFSAYAPALHGWAEKARAKGHEMLVEMPMALRDPGRGDAGPKALRAALETGANRDRMRWALGRFVGYVGVIGARHEALSGQAVAFAPVLGEMLQRGLIYVRPRPAGAIGGPAATERVVAVDLWLDTRLDPDTIDRRMRLAEALARGRGWVVVAVGAYPMTVDAVRRWAQALEGRDLIAAPLTAVVLPAR